jgi:hypothetical protein
MCSHEALYACVDLTQPAGDTSKNLTVQSAMSSPTFARRAIELITGSGAREPGRRSDAIVHSPLWNPTVVIKTGPGSSAPAR